ncbi:MAG: hypothetical protein B7Z83_09245, partial [Thiomonas sp. 20-64-5]
MKHSPLQKARALDALQDLRKHLRSPQPTLHIAKTTASTMAAEQAEPAPTQADRALFRMAAAGVRPLCRAEHAAPPGMQPSPPEAIT